MPSRYEPCGIGQLIALRYGTVPIVRRTGGLSDTVKEFDATRRSGTGFLWDAFEADAMLEAIRRAAGAYRRPELWSVLVRNGMTEDFSWDASAREYALLYKKVLRPAGSRPSRRSR
jgi:starch synthase